MTTPALYIPDQVVVEVIQDGDEMAYVKFPSGKVLWVKAEQLDFDDLVGDDDWEPDMGSPTDHDEHIMNEDDCREDAFDYDAGDIYDFEYDR